MKLLPALNVWFVTSLNDLKLSLLQIWPLLLLTLNHHPGFGLKVAFCQRQSRRKKNASISALDTLYVQRNSAYFAW